MNGEQRATKMSFWRTKSGIVTCVFLGVAAILLIFEHRVHALEAMPYLPYLLILACPLMHLFMHRGHSGHGPGSRDARPRDRTRE